MRFLSPSPSKKKPCPRQTPLSRPRFPRFSKRHETFGPKSPSRWLDYEAAGGQAERSDLAVQNTLLLNQLFDTLKPQVPKKGLGSWRGKLAQLKFSGKRVFFAAHVLLGFFLIRLLFFLLQYYSICWIFLVLT